MKKVAVFGNTGAGKSTLSKKLAEITDLPLYTLDKIQYKSGGEEVKHQEYTYDSKEGSLNLLVNNRFFVRINGKNIKEIELREWWQLIDYQSLIKISS